MTVVAASGLGGFRLSFVEAAGDVPGEVRASGRGPDGEFALVLRPGERRGVLVLVRPDGAATFWRGAGEPSDAPGSPAAPLGLADAVALVSEPGAAPPPGPARARWSGTITFDGGTPRVEIARRLPGRGLLRLASIPNEGWSWRVERSEAWAGRSGGDAGIARTLAQAIEDGLARARAPRAERGSARRTRPGGDHAAHPAK